MIQVPTDYQAPAEVRQVIQTMGRTEDLVFSPSRRKMAIAAFEQNAIYLFSISMSAALPNPRIVITDVCAFTSRALQRPHGVDFLNEETLVVANRKKYVNIFELPPLGAERKQFRIKPLRIIKKHNGSRLDSPGSIATYPCADGEHQLIICDNYSHVVTHARLDACRYFKVREHQVLLAKDLEIPDGVEVSANRRWIAISNHVPGTILVYRNDAALNRDSVPVAVLHGMDCPHGIRFAEKDRKILCVDSATHYLHVYATDGEDWGGDYQPFRKIQMLDDETFQRGRYNVEEGGPKGLDLDETAGVMAMTCEHQPLSFYKLESLLQPAQA